MVTNASQEIQEVRSAAECTQLCLERFGGECKSIIHEKHNKPQCLISSEYLVTDTDLVNGTTTPNVGSKLFSAGRSTVLLVNVDKDLTHLVVHW